MNSAELIDPAAEASFEKIISLGYPNAYALNELLATVTGEDTESKILQQLAIWDRDDRAAAALRAGNMGAFADINSEVI